MVKFHSHAGDLGTHAYISHFVLRFPACEPGCETPRRKSRLLIQGRRTRRPRALRPVWPWPAALFQSDPPGTAWRKQRNFISARQLPRAGSVLIREDRTSDVPNSHSGRSPVGRYHTQLPLLSWVSDTIQTIPNAAEMIYFVQMECPTGFIKNGTAIDVVTNASLRCVPRIQ